MTATDSEPQRPGRLATLFVLLAAALDAAGMGLVMPVMPELLREFAPGGDLAGAAAIGGWIAFSYAAAQFLCAPAIGALSDAVGRRPVLLFSMAAMAVEYAIMASTTLLWVLFAARLASGVAGATMSAVRAWLADVTPPEERGRAFGRIGAAFGAGFIFGPAIGGLLGELGPRAPFWAAAALSAVNFALGWFVLRESLPRARRRRFTPAAANPFRALRRAALLPGLAPFLLALLLYDVGTFVYPAAWSYVTTAAFGWSTAQIGGSLALYGLTAGLSQAFLIGPAQRRLGRRGAVTLGLAVEVPLMLGMLVVTQGWIVYALIPFLGMTAIIGPSLQGLISAAAPDDRQGEISGVIAAMHGVAAVISPPVMTGIFAIATAGPGPGWPTAPFVPAAALILLALWIFRRAPDPDAAPDASGSTEAKTKAAAEQAPAAASPVRPAPMPGASPAPIIGPEGAPTAPQSKR